MSTAKITIHQLSPLQIHESRYSDKYMNKAMLDALHSRILCPDCDNLLFVYDPEDHDYLKCHKCGARKRVPINIVKFTPDWGNEQRRKDGFNYLFGLQKTEETPTEVEK